MVTKVKKVKKFGVRGTVNQEQVRRLGIYIENMHPGMEMRSAVVKNIEKHKAKGKYDKNKHIKSNYNVVNAMLKDKKLRALEGLHKGNVSPATRKAVAVYLTSMDEDE